MQNIGARLRRIIKSITQSLFNNGWCMYIDRWDIHIVYFVQGSKTRRKFKVLLISSLRNWCEDQTRPADSPSQMWTRKGNFSIFQKLSKCTFVINHSGTASGVEKAVTESDLLLISFGFRLRKKRQTKLGENKQSSLRKLNLLRLLHTCFNCIVAGTACTAAQRGTCSPLRI